VSETIGSWEALVSGFTLAGLLMAAAVLDLRTRTIPNMLSLVVVLLAAVHWGVNGDAVAFFAAAGLGIVFLAVGFFLFAIGWIGGGDAKLIAAVVAWFGAAHFGAFVLMMTVAGVVLALVLYTVKRVSGRGLGDKSTLPYGVAIAAGAISTLPIALAVN
jgi:prepilin peptidase CpaA